MKSSVFLFALLFGSVPAHAADDRLQTLTYDPDEVVRVVGRAGIQSTIQFGADERIENIAVGDSGSWEVTPNRRGSVIFLKPVEATKRTNMTVVTDHRTYLFDLIPGTKDSTPLYSLKFRYPADHADQVATKTVTVASQISARPMVDRSLADALYFDWRSKGAKRLLPSRSFDDGRSLYVAWNTKTPLPAISAPTQSGADAPVAYKVRGGYIVISPVPTGLTFRYGDDIAHLWRAEPLPPAPTESAPEPSRVLNVAVAEAAASPASASAATQQVSQPTRSTQLMVRNTADLMKDDLSGGHR
jgi:type IV secretion system protein VirB9